MSRQRATAHRLNADWPRIWTVRRPSIWRAISSLSILRCSPLSAARAIPHVCTFTLRRRPTDMSPKIFQIVCHQPVELTTIEFRARFTNVCRHSLSPEAWQHLWSFLPPHLPLHSVLEPHDLEWLIRRSSIAWGISIGQAMGGALT